MLCLICVRSLLHDHYYCAHDHPGPVNAAGDTLRSLAESNGLFEVIKYLHDPSAYSTGESVYAM